MKLGNYRTQSDFKMVPAGTHVGVVTGLAYLGLQPSGNPQYKDGHKLALIISFPNEKTEDGTKNLTVTQLYGASTAPKATFRKVIESLAGGPFKTQADADDYDIRNLIGKSALFSIVHKVSGDKTFANVGGVIGLPAGMPVPPVLNDILFFCPPEQTNGEYLEALNRLPEWLRKKWEERIPDENAAGIAV
jgi:hypothetical protein